MANQNTENQFKGKLAKYYGLKPTGQESRRNSCLNQDSLWDIFIGGFYPKDSFPTMQLFPSDDQKVISAAFGDEAGNEWFPLVNALLVPKWIEHDLASGFILIVPDAPRNATHAQRSQWTVSHPRHYIFRIIDGSLEANKKDKTIDLARKIRFRDLDGESLQWRNDCRPQARYLYYLYCRNIYHLSCSGHNLRGQTSLQQEIWRYWGSPAKYIGWHVTNRFIDEIGHGLSLFFHSYLSPVIDNDLLMVALDMQQKGNDQKKSDLDHGVLMITTDDERMN